MNSDIKIERPENMLAAEKKDVPEKEDSTKKLTVGYLDVIWLAMILAFLSIAAYDRFFASKVVTVDLTGFVKEQKELLAQGKIGETDVADGLDQFWKFLQKQPKNLTVVNKDAVLANGKEIPFYKVPMATDKSAEGPWKK